VKARGAIALLSALVALATGEPAHSQGMPAGSVPPAGQAPAAAQPALPPGYGYPPGNVAQPGYGYPPGYVPPPGYNGYPPGYAYPAPYPGYPPYPQPLQPPPPPEPIPTGRWRLGLMGTFLAQGTLSYKLKYRGDPLLAYTGGAGSSLGFAPFVEYQATRYVFLGFSLQYLATVKWKPSATASTNELFGGSGKEVDFLPQIGVTIPASRRLHFLAFGAVGYSLVFASDLVKVYADPGTAHGLVAQAGAGLLYAVGQKGFLELRGSYQWGFQNNQVKSATTDQNADIEVHSRYFGLHGGGGVWF
jgi:hypothetical protein